MQSLISSFLSRTFSSSGASKRVRSRASKSPKCLQKKRSELHQTSDGMPMSPTGMPSCYTSLPALRIAVFTGTSACRPPTLPRNKRFFPTYSPVIK